MNSYVHGQRDIFKNAVSEIASKTVKIARSDRSICGKTSEKSEKEGFHHPNRSFADTADLVIVDAADPYFLTQKLDI